MNILKKLMSVFHSKKNTSMEKEIYEQADVVFEIIKKYINSDYSINIELPDEIECIALIASGSSYHSATIAANFFREKMHISAQSYYASEISLMDRIDVNKNTLYIFISQSGETTDTNKALELISDKTDKTLALTNTKNSTLYKSAKYKLLTYAGAEKAIASTKAMTAQTYCIFLIAAKLMQLKFMPARDFIDELLNVPEYINTAFTKRSEISKYANTLVEYDNAAILASGMFYPLAKEAALKIKETSYINVTAYPTGEFLYGHIAILNKRCAVIAFVNNINSKYINKVFANVNNNYKTDSLIIASKPDILVEEKNIISIFTSSDIEFLFTTLILMQFLALDSAKILSKNVDKPQGLSKIVK